MREALDQKHIREEQDRAYEESLLQDREKEEQRIREAREHDERLYQAEIETELAAAIRLSEELTNLSRVEQRLKALRLPDEPKNFLDDQAIRVVVQFPTGEKSERSFYLSDRIGDVRNFVQKMGLEENGNIPVPENFRLVTDFPRQVWGEEDMHLRAAQFKKRVLMRVEAF